MLSSQVEWYGVRIADRRQAAGLGEVGAELAVVDRLVHADVERLLARRRVVERGEDRVDEVLDVDEVALHRPPVARRASPAPLPLST